MHLNCITRVVGIVFTQDFELSAVLYGMGVDIWLVGIAIFVLISQTAAYKQANRSKFMARLRARIDAGHDPLSIIISLRRLASSKPLLLDLLRGIPTFNTRNRLSAHNELTRKWFEADFDASVKFTVIADVNFRLRKLNLTGACGSKFM